MTRNNYESDEVDSKVFQGRVLTLLGEIHHAIFEQTRFLRTKFFDGGEEEGPDYSRINEGDDDE